MRDGSDPSSLFALIYLLIIYLFTMEFPRPVYQWCYDKHLTATGSLRLRLPLVFGTLFSTLLVFGGSPSIVKE